ncbi:metal ABC transporter ATP-binding protein [Paenibacillus antri]|uniref:Metal ABC transporter ATP-binding protein n=1 Tax=Paenibacillus antri TaxID=2582848 RepID=A0A5R9GJB8_9BACL|nr:metal ABC transporter ATP-binding protein [Paenibacillus antri]TLS52973.1 metal ABC transporter ATP-binding protein [Paenibacillus antri]
MAPVIEVRNLSFSYDDKKVIEDLSFQMNARDFVGLIGSNGAGKTTLLKTLVGLLKPTSGELLLFGKPIRQFDEWSRIGYVPQKNALNPLFPATVREVVLSGLYGKRKLYRRITAEDRQRCDDALYAMQIADLADRRIGQLSGGQQQRAFLARALVGNPELLILDEPTVGIDAETQRSFFSMLRHMHAHHNIAFLMVSHDVDMMRAYLGDSPAATSGKLKFYVKSMDGAASCRETDLTHALKDWPGASEPIPAYQ